MSFTIASAASRPLVKFMVRVRSATQAQEQLAPTREVYPDAAVYDEAGRKIEDAEVMLLAEQERLSGRIQLAMRHEVAPAGTLCGPEHPAASYEAPRQPYG